MQKDENLKININTTATLKLTPIPSQFANGDKKYDALKRIE